MYSQFMMHGQKNIKLISLSFWGVLQWAWSNYVSVFHELWDARRQLMWLRWRVRGAAAVTAQQRQTDRQTHRCGVRSWCGTKNFWSRTPISEETDLSPCVGGQSQHESPLTVERSHFQLSKLFPGYNLAPTHPTKSVSPVTNTADARQSGESPCVLSGLAVRNGSELSGVTSDTPTATKT